MSGIDGANATREAVILWRARYHDDRGEEWMQWGYWSQKNGANGYENKPGFDYEERLFIPQSSTADALAWELEAARDYHREAFEGDSSGLATDEHRAKANERLWAAVEAVLDVAPNPALHPASPAMIEITDKLRDHAGSPVHHWEDWANRSDSLLREAADYIDRLEGANCPRPCNHRPDDFTIGQCNDADECGCDFRRALTPVAETPNQDGKI